MRPPEHWHLRRHRRRRWRRFLLPAALALSLAIIGGWLWLGGGGSGPQRSRAAIDASACGAAACVPTPASESVAVGAPAPAPRGRAAVVLEDSCDSLLYGYNADLRLPPASLTKIATALVAVDHASLDDIVDVQVNSTLLAASTDSTVMGLQPGMRLSMGDLLNGLLMASGADAAIAIAQDVSGNVPAFVDLMNQKVAQLGLSNTHFTNPHGLDDAGLYTSARDIAELGRALLANPQLAAIVRTKQYQPGWEGPPVSNGNALLDTYPGAIGVKIGYTEGAQQTIVAAAERDGRTIIVSVLASPDRFADATALLDWAFARTRPACATPAVGVGG